MLSLPGRLTRTCEGLSRREWLRAGGLGCVGTAGTVFGLPQLLAARSSPAAGAAGFGRARSCIVLFMFGAPAHQDTWDLKPEAPAEIRGEFQPIATGVPGIRVCEHLPLLARRIDKLAQIRSVTHPDNTHTVAMHYMLTGVRHARPATNPQNAPDDFPCFGAVMGALQTRRVGPARQPRERATADNGTSALPAAVSLNAPANQVSANNHIFPGFFGGFLGHGCDPLFISQHASDADFQALPAVTARERLLDRRRLLEIVDRQSAALEHGAKVGALSDFQRQAIELITSPAARKAFDISREPEAMRQRYGSTPFGQGCLLARRLVEAGVSLVTVNWERDDAYWDTHADNFKKHRDPLLPNLDRGFSALLDDLSERGLLDETLIVWLAEFGRTPKINGTAGRDHWAACNTVVLAGAGVPGGTVYGASDRHAAYPARDPVAPEDLAATIYHLLGVDPTATLHTPEGRPVPLTTGQPLVRLL
ncbi:MAG: DUF1501 domain-containing protein [Planctomycetes bacterium]|nr:DUF1501 domain-containing protein [Planctomycetota bacterium]